MDTLIQQINLYQPAFRQKREPFTAGVMGLILLLAAAVMLLVSLFEMYQMEEIHQRVKSIEQKNQEMLVKLEEVKEQLQPKEINQLLVAKRDSLSGDLRDARRLSRLLDLKIQDEGQPYSAYFRGLAESPVEGLWLKQLKITDGGEFLSLSGHTLKPELVPRLLQLLKSQAVFDGHAFGEVKMMRGQEEDLNQPVQFHLQTISSSEGQVDAG